MMDAQPASVIEVASEKDPDVLWVETPLIYSNYLSQSLQASVYLKLENLQPSHSFKYRGISYFVAKKRKELGEEVHFIIASGGNAGLAAARAARRLCSRCTVFLPEGVAASTIELLKSEQAEVVVAGGHYAEALKAAEGVVAKEPNTVMIPAYDHPLLWEGHSSMITEIYRQIPKKPHTIFCSVGGGGLLGGILEGCKAVGWQDVPIATLETMGSDCFYHSMSLNNARFNSAEKALPLGIDLMYDQEHAVHLAHFRKFDSRASGSLGASQPAGAVLRAALEWPGGVKSVSVPDAISMETLALFANHQKMLVELACSTTLVPAFHPALFDKIVPPLESGERRVVVFIVCGGFKISLREAAEYQQLLDEEPRGTGETWAVKYDDGALFTFAK